MTMTVYLVWRTPVMIADTYELEDIYDNKESANNHAKRIEGEVQEYDVNQHKHERVNNEIIQRKKDGT